MAVLSKIRQRSGLLLLAIGFALLAFVVQDLFTKGFNSLSKEVGSVNGKDISFEDFRVKVANVEKSGQGMSSMQASNQVWNQEVSIALLSTEFDKLGLRVGEKHILEVLKNDPNIGQNQMFLNAAGKFDIQKFKDYFKSNPEGIQFLKDKEKDAEINAKYQIYNSLVKGGLFTTEAEGKLMARIGDIVIGNCGHVSMIITGSTRIDTEGRPQARVTDQFMGCFQGMIITGCIKTEGI